MTAASNNSMQLEGKTILLGITGGIAAYKSCNIVRLLQKRGARVKVVMSEHATEFVGPLTFRALTNEPVAVGLFDDPSDPIHHISLAQEPDLVVVAPATANIIAKMANGIADDLISTTLLATPRPIAIAPAMNNGMWKASATQANMATLRDRGVHVVGPGSGYLACGDVDTGRMSEPEDIVEAVCEVLNPVPQDLAGKRVVITAGPTHEPIDPVRFIGNFSSGKMGFSIAEECRRRGAEVTLVAGPTALQCDAAIRRVNVESAQEMYEACLPVFDTADAAILSAAVADFTPEQKADSKIKREADDLVLRLRPTHDIAKTLGQRKRPGQRLVCFALETNDEEANARGKLERKNADFVVLNSTRIPGTTFNADDNQIAVVTREGVRSYPKKSKQEVASDIIDVLQGLLTDTTTLR